MIQNCNDFGVLVCFQVWMSFFLICFNYLSNPLGITYYLNKKFLLLEPSPIQHWIILFNLLTFQLTTINPSKKHSKKSKTGFFKENVRNPVWICRDPVSLILGIRFSLILGTWWWFSLILGTRFEILGTRIGSKKRLKKNLVRLTVLLQNSISKLDLRSHKRHYHLTRVCY